MWPTDGDGPASGPPSMTPHDSLPLAAHREEAPARAHDLRARSQHARDGKRPLTARRDAGQARPDAPASAKARERIEQIVVMHPHGPLRLMLRMALTVDGYTVTEVPTFAAVLRHLHAAADATPMVPMVVIVGNWDYTFQAEDAFFARIAADRPMARRHRFVLLSTVLEWLPADLDATLRSLGVLQLRMPFQMPDLLALIALAVGRTHSNDESAG